MPPKGLGRKAVEKRHPDSASTTVGSQQQKEMPQGDWEASDDEFRADSAQHLQERRALHLARHRPLTAAAIQRQRLRDITPPAGHRRTFSTASVGSVGATSSAGSLQGESTGGVGEPCPQKHKILDATGQPVRFSFFFDFRRTVVALDTKEKKRKHARSASEPAPRTMVVPTIACIPGTEEPIVVDSWDGFWTHVNCLKLVRLRESLGSGLHFMKEGYHPTWEELPNGFSFRLTEKEESPTFPSPELFERLCAAFMVTRAFARSSNGSHPECMPFADRVCGISAGTKALKVWLHDVGGLDKRAVKTSFVTYFENFIDQGLVVAVTLHKEQLSLMDPSQQGQVPVGQSALPSSLLPAATAGGGGATAVPIPLPAGGKSREGRTFGKSLGAEPSIRDPSKNSISPSGAAVGSFDPTTRHNRVLGIKRHDPYARSTGDSYADDDGLQTQKLAMNARTLSTLSFEVAGSLSDEGYHDFSDSTTSDLNGALLVRGEDTAVYNSGQYGPGPQLVTGSGQGVGYSAPVAIRTHSRTNSMGETGSSIGSFVEVGTGQSPGGHGGQELSSLGFNAQLGVSAELYNPHHSAAHLRIGSQESSSTQNTGFSANAPNPHGDSKWHQSQPSFGSNRSEEIAFSPPEYQVLVPRAGARSNLRSEAVEFHPSFVTQPSDSSRSEECAFLPPPEYQAPHEYQMRSNLRSEAGEFHPSLATNGETPAKRRRATRRTKTAAVPHSDSRFPSLDSLSGPPEVPSPPVISTTPATPSKDQVVPLAHRNSPEAPAHGILPEHFNMVPVLLSDLPRYHLPSLSAGGKGTELKDHDLELDDGTVLTIRIRRKKNRGKSAEQKAKNLDQQNKEERATGRRRQLQAAAVALGFATRGVHVPEDVPDLADLVDLQFLAVVGVILRIDDPKAGKSSEGGVAPPCDENTKCYHIIKTTADHDGQSRPFAKWIRPPRFQSDTPKQGVLRKPLENSRNSSTVLTPEDFEEGKSGRCGSSSPMPTGTPTAGILRSEGSPGHNATGGHRRNVSFGGSSFCETSN